MSTDAFHNNGSTTGVCSISLSVACLPVRPKSDDTTPPREDNERTNGDVSRVTGLLPAVRQHPADDTVIRLCVPKAAVFLARSTLRFTGLIVCSSSSFGTYQPRACARSTLTICPSLP